MSNIDQALKLWERQNGKIPSSHTPQRFRIDQYGREEPGAEAVTRLRPAAAPGVASGPAPVETVPSPRVRGRLGADRVRPADPELEARLVTTMPGGVPVEQYRRLAAVLHDVQLQQGLKTLMVTSALPNEGKTLTIVNLALTLSESYARKVLLVDADLRWPSVHRTLGVDNRVGLSEALLREGFELPLQQVSPHLSVLPAGRPGPTPLAALTSTRMRSLVDECAAQFDWVLIDTPPVGLMPDGQVLARMTRAVVLVIGAGVAPAAAVKRAVEELGADSIIGAVLNRVDERQIPQAGYYADYPAD